MSTDNPYQAPESVASAAVVVKKSKIGTAVFVLNVVALFIYAPLVFIVISQQISRISDKGAPFIIGSITGLVLMGIISIGPYVSTAFAIRRRSSQIYLAATVMCAIYVTIYSAFILFSVILGDSMWKKPIMTAFLLLALPIANIAYCISKRRAIRIAMPSNNSLKADGPVGPPP